MEKVISFIKEFFDCLVKMAMVVFYASCAMIFVAGFLMAFASVHYVWAMSTILLPSLFAVILSLYLAYVFTKGDKTKC